MNYLLRLRHATRLQKQKPIVYLTLLYIHLGDDSVRYITSTVELLLILYVALVTAFA